MTGRQLCYLPYHYFPQPCLYAVANNGMKHYHVAGRGMLNA